MSTASDRFRDLPENVGLAPGVINAKDLFESASSFVDTGCSALHALIGDDEAVKLIEVIQDDRVLKSGGYLPIENPDINFDVGVEAGLFVTLGMFVHLRGLDPTSLDTIQPDSIADQTRYLAGNRGMSIFDFPLVGILIDQIPMPGRHGQVRSEHPFSFTEGANVGFIAACLLLRQRHLSLVEKEGFSIADVVTGDSLEIDLTDAALALTVQGFSDQIKTQG